jgi:pimeloyl-ACP methyl ester carboxylesterase
LVEAAMDDDRRADEATRRLAELRGAVRLIGEGVVAATDVVQDMQRAITATPLGVLAAVHPVGEAARKVHEGVRDGVYAAVRGASRLLFRAADAALERGSWRPRQALSGPVVGALRGVIGDHLAQGDNPLGCAMQLRVNGQALAPTREAVAAALPAAGPRVAVFVHGLACDESCWARGATEREPCDYAALLAERHGYTTLQVRYNSGLRVADNGAALAALLGELAAVYPGGIERLTLIGHSMGGLVARSAAHHGQASGAAWVSTLRDVVCLGSPQLGAPLEQLGAAAVAVLAAIGVTAPIARVFDARSAGIKDMHTGAIVDAGEALRPPQARYHSIAGSLGGPGHPLGWAIGDGMVRVRSAHGGEDGVRIPGLHHMDLLNHPAVFAEIEAALAD